MSGELIYKEEAYAIQGAIFEVYRDKGHGFAEPVYQECMEIELSLRSIEFVPQQQLQLTYKGQTLKQFYKPDLICFNKIIVELKALSAITGEHRAQVLNYLKATGYTLGLLVNFGSYPKASVERIVLSQ